MSPECFLDDRTHYKKVLQLHKRKPEASMLPQTNLSSFQKLAVENSVIALHWCLLPQTTACFALSLSEHNFLIRGSLPVTTHTNCFTITI